MKRNGEGNIVATIFCIFALGGVLVLFTQGGVGEATTHSLDENHGGAYGDLLPAAVDSARKDGARPQRQGHGKHCRLILR